MYHNQKYCIWSCGQKWFYLQWVSLKHPWKITTMCVQHNAWLSTLGNAPSKVFLLVVQLKLHQEWMYLIMFWLGLFISYDSKIDYKWIFRLFYCHQLNDIDNWQLSKQKLVWFLQNPEYSTMDILKLWHHLLE